MAQVEFYTRRPLKPISDPLPIDEDRKASNKRKVLRLKLYCNGDRFFKGKKVCLDPRSYNSFTEFMNHLTSHMPPDINLPNGVRQIYTPKNGNRVVNMESLKDGMDCVLAGNESFKPIKYGTQALEPWGKSHNQPGHTYSYRFGGRYGPQLAGADDSHYAGYNAFPPSRFYRQVRSNRYPYLNPPAQANRYKILRGEPETTSRSNDPNAGQTISKPRVITVVQSGPRSPRKVIKVLLNRRSVQPFEQLVYDISQQFGGAGHSHDAPTDGAAAGIPNTDTRIYTVRGREVQGISDFFREDDMFIWVGTQAHALSVPEASEILRDIYPDKEWHVRTLIKEWERRQRRAERLRRKQHEQQHIQNQHQPQTKRTSLGYSQKFETQQPSNSMVSLHLASSEDDKRDSGFDESEPVSHSHVYDEKEETNRSSTYRGLQTDLPPLRPDQRETQQELPKPRIADEDRRRHGLPLLRHNASSKDIRRQLQQDKFERRSLRRQQAIELERKRQRQMRQAEEEQQAAEALIRQRRQEAKEAKEKEARERMAREKEARARENRRQEQEREREAAKRAEQEKRLAAEREEERRRRLEEEEAERKRRLAEERKRRAEEEEAERIRHAEEEEAERQRAEAAKVTKPLSPLPVAQPTSDKVEDTERLPVVEEERPESAEQRQRVKDEEEERRKEEEDERKRQQEKFAAAEAAARQRALDAEAKREKEEEEAAIAASEAAKAVDQRTSLKEPEAKPEPVADDEANKENRQVQTVEEPKPESAPVKPAIEEKKGRGRQAGQRGRGQGKIMRQYSKAEHVLDKYELGKVMGDGNFAIVRACRKRESGNEYAMKIIDKAKLRGRENMIENEIDIMRACSHTNIVKLREEYETPTEIFLVMELVKGGDLFDAITQSVKFSEPQSAAMVNDLSQALFYLHSRMIVHRDLKPENLLVVRNKNGSLSLKLADFGLAMEVKRLIYTVCGTPTYVAPEILEEKGYGLEVDLWALGVITYILLCGFPPFRSPERKQTELFEIIKSGRFEFLSPYWDNISSSAKDLISHLLIVDRKRRYSAIDVLCHPWVISLAGSLKIRKPVSEYKQSLRAELESRAKADLEDFRNSRNANNNT